ncbi:hypothetical protein ACTVJH_09490 [Desulfoplanes sp. PS50]|jgi:hypothetical protein
MNTIRFSSTVKNGVIQVPEEYTDLENITVKVTLHTVSNKNNEEKQFIDATYNSVIEDDSVEDTLWSKYL